MYTERLEEHGDNDYIQNISNEKWEELWRDIANNTHLVEVHFFDGALNDHKTSFFFRVLQKSSSIEEMLSYRNELKVCHSRGAKHGAFLQNANRLAYLDLGYNNIESEGFNVLFLALCVIAQSKS